MPAAASAQTAVNVYGLVAAQVGSYKRSDTPRSVTAVNGGGFATSFWGIRGSEDLGRGLRASFVLESFFVPDTGAFGRSPTESGFSRNAWLGIAGRFGQVTVGRQTNPFFGSTVGFNPFAASTSFSPLVLQSWILPFGRNLVGDTVWDNSVMYASPEIGGVKAMAIYSAGEQPGRNGTNNYGLNLGYGRGPFSATLAYQKVEVGTLVPPVAPSTRQTAYLAGALYDFKVVKLFGTYQETRSAVSNVETQTAQLGAAVPIGAGRLLASWSQTRREQPGARTTQRDTAAIGYAYGLSRRTELFAVTLSDRQTARDTGTTVLAGLQQQF